MSRFEIFWRYFILIFTENVNMKWGNAQMAYIILFFYSFEIDLCDDISAICTADENFPYYIMKSTTCIVQLRKSHVDKWGWSLVLEIKYYLLM